jgi:hypothetical protein
MARRWYQRYALLVILILTLIACTPAPEKNTALPRAFTKIAATLETGVSYRDYPALLADANTELRLYADSADGKAHPAAVEGYRAALARYVEARELWSRKFEADNDMRDQICAQAIYDHDYGRRYPDAPRNAMQCQNGGFRVDALLPYLWRDAAQLASQAASKM